MLDYDQAWRKQWGGMHKYGPVHRHQRRLFLKLIKTIPQDEIKSVLDVGCGEGSNLVFLKSAFPGGKFHGCDISPAAIEQAKEILPEVDFLQIDIENQKIDGKFDFVLCCDVLEHINKDVTTLDNIYQMCNKYFLISSLQGRMRVFEKNVGHIRNYKYGEVETKLKKVGFKVLTKFEWGFPWYSPLYRDLFNNQNVEKLSYGEFNSLKKFACHLIYIVFFLNFYNKGDLIMFLCKKHKK